MSTLFYAYIYRYLEIPVHQSIEDHLTRPLLPRLQTCSTILHHMAPKSTFSIPMGDVTEIVTETKRTKRGVRIIEREVPFHSSKELRKPRNSGSQSVQKTRDCSEDNVMHADTHKSDKIEESHTLDAIAEQGDDGINWDIDEPSLQSTVCFKIFSELWWFIYLQTPMGEWLELRDKYLGLLLEMEGLTKSSKCSMCSNEMAFKCSDCVGSDYFCKGCCIKLHMRSPFHQIFRWTGSHFEPTSLYALGFMLCLGHDGEQCPSTVEVC